ncbi:MAG TPA: DUF362 domain-containing protein [Syntrophomonadaceae bacterium]|nr:DUF362 domain-containing protein [Syntrophomonadaceae bacterium]
MKKSKVAVICCNDYQEHNVEQAVRKGLELVGAGDGLFRAGETILLKPNLLAASPPDKAVTTHPAVFRSAASALIEMGVKLKYGDSPALGGVEKVAKKCGLADIAQELNIGLADFTTPETIHCAAASQNKQFVIAKGIKECDGLVSLGKLKTHGLMKITAAVKNQFGCIPGLLKGEFHIKLPRPHDFARMLVDLNVALNPRLFIVDGIVVMEGNGPRGGAPRHLGLLLFSTDPVALDSTACRVLGIDPEHILTVTIGREAGLGQSSRDEIELVGDGVNFLPLQNFKEVEKPPDFAGKAEWLRQYLLPRPVITPTKCVSCGICVHMCPLDPPVVNWAEEPGSGIPVYDYQRCIRCYCCQELCPEGAIELYTPWLGRTLGCLRPKGKRGSSCG